LARWTCSARCASVSLVALLRRRRRLVAVALQQFVHLVIVVPVLPAGKGESVAIRVEAVICPDVLEGIDL
jgi:hypothetical protein